METQRDKPETKNGHIDAAGAAPSPMFETFEDMMGFMRREYPPPAEPRKVAHVILDADDTIWEIKPWGLATLSTPQGKTDGNILPVKLNIDEATEQPWYWGGSSPQGTAELEPSLRATLKRLKEKGIPVSIASSNDKAVIEKYLNAFGLRDQIADVEATLYATKDEMVKKIAERQHVDTKDILFVDDSSVNCEDVTRYTDAGCLLLGYHIDELAQLLDYIK